MKLMMFPDDILEQATDWYDRLGQLTAEEHRLYLAWLDADEQHRAAAEYIARHFGDNEALVLAAASTFARPESAPSARAYAAPADEPATSRFGWLDWIMPVAPMALAMLLLIVPALFWFAPESADVSIQQQFATVTAERKQVQLEDGSRVDINAVTRLAVELNAEQRTVDLQQGEAFFSVARDVKRPFLVRHGDVEVRVLGTAFNVDTTSDCVVVAVDHGIVEVVAAGTRQRLLAGDGLRVGPDGVQRFKPVAAGNWREGRRQVQQEPLAEMIAHLQVYSETPIELDGVDASLSFSGQYDPADVDGSLALVAEVLDLQLERSAEAIRLQP